MNIQGVKRKLLALAMTVAAGVGWVAWRPISADAYAADRPLPIYCVEKDQKVCSISFDAAWGNKDTQQLIDILAKYDVKTTFFVVGDWASKYPESVKALYDAGHEVMSHSDNHAHYNALSTEEIVADLNVSCDKIEAVTGVRPTLVRCPFGEYDDHVITAIRSIGLEPIQWDVDSLDWKGISAGKIARRVIGKIQPGSIVLFHNAAKHTPEALPGILETLIADGYKIIPISQLIIQGQCDVDYTIDHTGKQMLPA